MPRLFIHCGLHKTGTTALQYMLHHNTLPLFEAGLLYPGVGTLWGRAHHNIAWQLARDRRFIRANGTVKELLEQVALMRGDTVISSEDFETLLLTPDAWRPLIGPMQSMGFDVTFVVYLRDPGSYLQSLFAENVKHGCDEEFGAVARSVAERGQYRFKDWVFQFSYDSIKTALDQLPGCTVIYRSFERLAGGSTITDFFDAIGRDSTGEMSRGEERGNERVDLGYLTGKFVRNRMEFTHVGHVEHIEDVVSLMVGGRAVEARMPQRLAEVIAQRTRSELKTRLDAEGGPMRRRREPPPSAWIVNISRLFSWETQVAATTLFDEAPGTGAEKLDALRNGDQRVFEAWRQWVAGGLEN